MQTTYRSPHRLARVHCRSIAIFGAAGWLLVSCACGPTAVGADSPEQPATTITGRVVNAAGRPAANAAVRAHFRSVANPVEERATTDDDGRFQLTLPIKREAMAGVRVQASSEDSSQLGYFRFSGDGEQTNAEMIDIQLEATKIARVNVVDDDGRPVADAHIAVQLKFPHTLADATTDTSGVARLRLPQSERIEAVAAWKDDVGLDYRLYSLSRDQQHDLNATAPEFPADGLETLTLSGAAPLTVRVVDERQKPLSGVSLYPWLLKKDSQSDELNLSVLMGVFSQRSDALGETTFRWLPAWQRSPLTIWPTAEGFVRSRASYDPASGSGTLQIQLNRLVPIRGRVVDAEGKPRAGISVAARGAHFGFDASTAATVTDEDGRYELLVAPDQIYLVTVKDSQWAAAPQDGFAVLQNQPAENKDFTLRKATRVFGRLTNEATGEPLADQRVTVYQYGQDLHSLEGVELPNPENSRRYVRPLQFYSTTTDSEGRFEFALGDGQFDIRPPQQEKTEKFEIAGEEEIEIDVTTAIEKQVELAGLVTGTNGEPLAGVRISGVPRSLRGRDWQAVTAADGTFRVQRFREVAYVHAASADGKLGVIVELPAEQDQIDLQLQPVGSATGRLLTSEADGPLARTRITYGVRVPHVKELMWSTRFGGVAITEEDGSFRLEGLVPGWQYDLNLESRSDGTIPSLTDVTVASGETVDLGELPEPKPRARYVPPTLEEQIESAFAVEGTPLQRHARATELIQLVNQHLLVVFGQPKDSRIHRLMEIRFEDPDFRAYSDEFRFMAIPTDPQHREAAAALADELDESLDGGHGDFLLVLLDRDGQKTATADSESLCNDGQLSKDKLFELLRSHLAEPLDAKQLLSDALQRAKAEGKRVLVQETATWCGPCHLLSRFLNGNRVWEKDYVWVKMDHRWTGAREVMAELRDGAEGGIPWYAILDADGKVLTTSNHTKTEQNIGYPGEKEGQEHFAAMLEATRQRMTAAEVQQLVEALAAEQAGH